MKGIYKSRGLFLFSQTPSANCMTSCMCGAGRREKGREEEGGCRQEGEAEGGEEEEEKMTLRLHWKFLIQGGRQTHSQELPVF